MKYFEIGDIRITSRTANGYLLTVAPDTAGGGVDRNTINYAGCDGEEVRDVYFKSRDFMIEGFILSNSERGYSMLRRKLLRSLVPKTSYPLVYYDGCNTYKAEAYIDGNITFGRVINGRNSAFVINITIPSFYFKSFKEVTKDVYRRADMVTGRFTLPMVFTKRDSTADIVNKGDVSAFPIFNLHCNEEMSENIVIRNDTTNEELQLNYKPVKGERIVIDAEQFKITSNLNGNIIKCLSADSTFFELGKGSVKLSCLTNGVSVSVNFYERYAGV